MTAPHAIDWLIAPFDTLTTRDLYDVLRIRQDVFIVEQDCAFGEIDGRDPAAIHLIGRRDGAVVAYARVFAPARAGETPSIGRVLTAPAARGTGLGREVMRHALALVQQLAPGAAVRLAAQAHLERFYRSMGFEPVGETYVEDGIVHLDMVRPAAVLQQPPIG